MSHHSVMTDKHGRRMRKLRISLLDACNMRCVYCMPDTPHFMPSEQWASTEEIVRIASHLTTLGIEEIRLTGGEPTLRKELLDIAHGLSGLELKKLGLTSNGFLLGPLLNALDATECRYLNISLDSLDAGNFRCITRRDAFEKVHSTILRARDKGFQVKVNMVVMRGLNDTEVPDFVAWSAEQRIPVRFLEVMKIGVMQEPFAERFIPAHELISNLRQLYGLTRKQDAVDATAYTFLADNGADIGFIASESEPFCGGCSRLRLSPQGHLRPCLFKNTGIDLKPLAFADYPQALAEVIAMKPSGRPVEVAQPMYQIGG